MLISAARYRSRRDSGTKDAGVAFTVSGSRLHILRCLRLLEVHTDGPVDLWIPPSAEALIPVLERHSCVRRVFISPAATAECDVVSGPIPVYGRYGAVVSLECDAATGARVKKFKSSRVEGPLLFDS